MYIIVFEKDRKGYWAGVYKDKEIAYKVYNEINELYFMSKPGKLNPTIKFRSYTIAGDDFITAGFIEANCMGVQNLYLIELGKHWKSLNEFLRFRSVTGVE